MAPTSQSPPLLFLFLLPRNLFLDKADFLPKEKRLVLTPRWYADVLYLRPGSRLHISLFYQVETSPGITTIPHTIRPFPVHIRRVLGEYFVVIEIPKLHNEWAALIFWFVGLEDAGNGVGVVVLDVN